MEQQEINIFEYWDQLWRKKFFIGVITFIATVISIGLSFLIPETFVSQAVLMPIGGQRGGGLAAAAAQMGVGGLLGGLGGASSEASQIMAILRSRTLAEKIIERNDLLPLLFSGQWDDQNHKWIKEPPLMEKAVESLKEHVIFFEDKKNQTISITSEFHIPEVAAKVTNDYIQVLYLSINSNTFTTAKRNRIFIEGQLQRNKAELLEVGKALSSFYSSNRVSNAISSMDVDVTLNTGSDALDSGGGEGLSKTGAAYSTNSMDELQQKLLEVNQKIESVKVVKEVPQQVYLQYMTLRQELLGKVNALLTQQYELAKVDENKEDLTFQVIDWGRVPVHKFKPKKAEIVEKVFLISGFLSVLFVFLREYWKKRKDAG